MLICQSVGPRSDGSLQGTGVTWSSVSLRRTPSLHRGTWGGGQRPGSGWDRKRDNGKEKCAAAAGVWLGEWERGDTQAGPGAGLVSSVSLCVNRGDWVWQTLGQGRGASKATSASCSPPTS